MAIVAEQAAAAGSGQENVPSMRSSRWLTLVLLILGYGVYNLDKSIIAIIIEPLKAEFRLDDKQIGLFSAAMTLPLAIFCVPMGRMTDRLNRKIMLVVLVVGWSAMTVVGGFATSLAFLIFARCGVGVFESGYTPTSMSMLADEFSPRQRPTAMGLFNIGGPLGICLGMAMGGLVATQWGWRAAFFVAGAPGLLIAGLMLLLLREPQRGRLDDAPRDTAAVPLGRALFIWWAQKPSRFAVLGMICGAVFLAAIATWTPALLSRVQGISVAHAGIAGALIVGICGSLGAAAGGFAADKIGKVQGSRKLIVPSVGLTLSTITGLAGYLLVLPLVPMLALLSLSAFFAQSYMGPGYATALSFVPANIRGTVASLMLLCFGVLSYGIGTLIVGYVSDRTAAQFGVRSISAGMASTLAFSVLGAIYFARAYQAIRKIEQRFQDLGNDETG